MGSFSSRSYEEQLVNRTENISHYASSYDACDCRPCTSLCTQSIAKCSTLRLIINYLCTHNNYLANWINGRRIFEVCEWWGTIALPSATAIFKCITRLCLCFCASFHLCGVNWCRLRCASPTSMRITERAFVDCHATIISFDCCVYESVGWCISLRIEFGTGMAIRCQLGVCNSCAILNFGRNNQSPERKSIRHSDNTFV